MEDFDDCSNELTKTGNSEFLDFSSTLDKHEERSNINEVNTMGQDTGVTDGS